MASLSWPWEPLEDSLSPEGRKLEASDFPSPVRTGERLCQPLPSGESESADPIDTWEEELQPWERRWYEDHAYEPEREW